MPVTFTRKLPSGYRQHVVTILNQNHGRGLARDIQAHCAFVLATNCISHAKTVEQILALGLAQDAADADQLIREGEEQQL